ncbi:MAG: hypothetical protein RXQ80_08445 [Sulfolobaceae archaeon]
MSLEIDLFSSEEFEEEKKKFQFLYTNGYISGDQLKLAYTILGITVDDIEVIEFVDNNGEEVRLITPVIIISKPSVYHGLKLIIPNAEVADPYIQKFPTISLLSLEKTINSLATLKVPWRTFTIYVHSSYWNITPQTVLLLKLLVDELNQHGYSIILKMFKEFGDSEGEYDLSEQLKKVICHLRKKLGKAQCDDNEWWKYDLWGTSNFVEIDMKKVEKIALKFGVMPTVAKYIIIASMRNKPYYQYLRAFNISEDLAKKIIEAYNTS